MWNEVVLLGTKVRQQTGMGGEIGDSLSKRFGESPLTIFMLLKLKIALSLSHGIASIRMREQ